MLAFILAVIAPLIVVGLVVYWMFSAYWKAEDSACASYRILVDQSLPFDLNRIAADLRRLGFQFLATYDLMVPPRKNLPDHYVFQTYDGAVKVLVVQHGPFRSVTFQTMFSDGSALCTVLGLRKAPFPCTTGKLVQKAALWGSASRAYHKHTTDLRKMIERHGAPLRTQKAEEFQRLLNRHFVLPYHVRVARSALRLYRSLSSGILIAYALIAAVYLGPDLASGAYAYDHNLLDSLWVILIPAPLLPIPLVAWRLAWKINRRVLRQAVSAA